MLWVALLSNSISRTGTMVLQSTTDFGEVLYEHGYPYIPDKYFQFKLCRVPRIILIKIREHCDKNIQTFNLVKSTWQHTLIKQDRNTLESVTH